MQTLNTFNAILKEDYLGPIRDQLNNSTILLKRLQRNEEDVGGKVAVVPLLTGRNAGVGARREGDVLPQPGQQQYDCANYRVAHNYGRISISGPVIKASRKNKYAFVKAVDSEVKGMIKDMKDNINRQLHLDGSGILAVVIGDPTNAGGVGPTVITVDNTRYFQRGMRIALVNPASYTPGDQRANVGVLNVISKTANTITVAEAVHADAADGDYVVCDGNYRNEMMGLGGIVSNANGRGPAPPMAQLTVGGIDRTVAANAWWNANVLGNGGNARKLTLDLMQQAFDACEQEGGEVTMILSGYDIRRKYLALVKADGRFVNTMEFDGGFKTLEYNDKPYFVDRHFPNNDMLFLDESTLALYRMSDFEWMEEDGHILHRVPNQDAYEATLFLYATLGCSACNHNARLTDLRID